MFFTFLFYLAQLTYFVCNISYDSLFLKNPCYVTKKVPAKLKRIHSIVAAYDEPKNILKANFESQLKSEYPNEFIDIYPVVEEKDEKTVKAVLELSREMARVHPIIVPNNGTQDWPDVIKKWSKNKSSGYKGDTNLPFGKGRALTYAYYSSRYDLKDADVLTVFDAEDIIDPELFKYAVSGLEQGFGVVQGKIKYRNKDTNLLTALESIEPLIWSNQFYNHTSNPKIPYQVLGPAYFFEARLPGKIGGWSPYTTSEDVEFGLRCWERGNRLGILDVYTDELGVNSLNAWLKQRRRWARGHQKVFLESRLKGIESNFNFYTYSLNSQIMSAVSVIGVPTGIYMLLQTYRGQAYINPVFTLICLFNMANWIIMGYLIFKNTKHTVEFKGTADKLKFYVRVNPVSLMFYSMLWAIPITTAIKDCMSNKKIVWEKTPREGYEDNSVKISA
jgi:cellulose synthase/poly-beta-1,6-N-acetylglucosamine synthase-like glycosyltransferase